jgi:hypothetical protein
MKWLKACGLSTWLLFANCANLEARRLSTIPAAIPASSNTLPAPSPQLFYRGPSILIPPEAFPRRLLISTAPLRPASEAMDGLSAAASVIAVTQISQSVASLCSQYFTAVKNAKPDIGRLQGEVGRLNTVLEGAQQIFEGPNGARLQTS